MSLRSILMSADPVRVLRDLDVSGELADVEVTLADLRMEIPAGYQHKDNLTHSLQVLQNAIDRETDGPDLILRTAALFHDIGKPATREFHDEGVVTFEAHEVVGARMVRKILRAHGYSKDEISEISLLIAYHMRSHGFMEKNWTDSAVRRLKTDAGDDVTLNRLMIIFYSDITTKFEKKKKKMHAGVDALKAKIDEIAKADARKALRPALTGHDIMTIFGIKPGKELGPIMKFLNSDEGVVLSATEAEKAVRERFF